MKKLRPASEITWILFDFDGTLADSLQPVTSLVNRILKVFRMAPVSREKIGLWHKEDQGARSRRWLMTAAEKVTETVQATNLKEIRPVPHLQPVLFQLWQAGFHLGVVSSNTKSNLEQALRRLELTELFEAVTADQAMYHKEQGLRQFLTDKQLKPDEVIYVGDEVRDIEAARQAGMKVISVSWGYQDYQELARNHPDWLIGHPRQLLKIFKLMPWWQRWFRN